MKRIYVFLLVGMLSVSTSAFPQSARVSATLKETTIDKLFDEIKKQTGYSFWYDVADIDENKQITIDVKNETVINILESVFKGQSIDISITGNHIILTKSNTQQTAQSKRTIRGRVVDQTGDPLGGITVFETGMNNGTVTDESGNFELTLTKGNKLSVSGLGYMNEERDLTPASNVYDFILQPDFNLMNEVVVIGYGTLEKRMVTSSISSVKGDDLIQGIGGASVATALKGRVSGMTISGTHSPNSANTILLRGVASVNAGQGPLIVIDGIPGGDLRSLNQEDIASVDVLKDASAGAIYGTRAAGGVVLITTKKPQAGPIKVVYTGELSMETLRARPEVLSAARYRELGLGGENDVYDFGANTDWYDLLMNKNPLSHRHVINVTGGSEVANIYSTFSIQDQKGIAIGDGRKDYSGRVNANFKMYGGLVEILTHSEFRQANRDLRRSNGMYNAAIKLNPTYDPYDPENASGYNLKDFKGSEFNPLADVMLRQRDAIDKWLLADATLKINLTSDLSVQGTFGYDSRWWQATRYVSAHHRESDQNGYRGSGYHGFDKTENVSFETYATYSKVLKGHSFGAVAGYSFYEHNQESFNMTNYDFPVEGTKAWDMKSGNYLSDGKAAMTSEKAPRDRLLSFFARANYSYMDKYIATASVRHEGSSKFGADQRWATFWAVSGGWRISSENFMKDVAFVNDLKIRAGYGVTGNNDFDSPPGLTARVYGSNGMWLTDGQNWNSLYGSVRNVNPDLRWEETKGTNVGLDFSLLNDRLYGKFDYFWRNVSNLIFDQGVSQPPNVYPTTRKNIGTLKGRGWEFEVGGVPVQTKNFRYITSLRMSHNITKITSMGNVTYVNIGDNFPSPGAPGNPYRVTNDMQIGQWFMKKHAGFTEGGDWLVYDKDNNVIPASSSTDDDKRFLGNAIPKIELSWDHTVQYKNWDLSIALRSWIGFDVFNMPDMYYGVKIKENGINYLERAFDDERTGISPEKQLSDYWLEDGSFLKIDAIVLGYNLSLKKYNKFVNNIRFYFNARDLACFTNYTGLDPEVSFTNPLRPGLDEITGDAVFPKTRRFTLGIQVTF